MKRQEASVQPTLFELPGRSDAAALDTSTSEAAARVITGRDAEILSAEDQRDRALDLADKLGWSVVSALQKLGYSPDGEQQRTEKTPLENPVKSRPGRRGQNSDRELHRETHRAVTYEPLSTIQQRVNTWGADLVRNTPGYLAIAKKSAEQAKVQREIRERDARIAESWQQTQTE